MNTKKIICLYGGPGTGKSTACAGVYHALKTLGYDAEMNREYVKEWVWEKRKICGGDQPYFFVKQARRERVYMNSGVDFIVTDSPLVLTHFYGLKYDKYEQMQNTSLMMLKHHHVICKDMGYKVEHYFLIREKEYNPNGRLQTKEEAESYDKEIMDMLNNLKIKFTPVPCSIAVEYIVADLDGTI